MWIQIWLFQVVNAQNENSDLRKKMAELENQVQNADKVIQKNQETIDELLANQANVDNVNFFFFCNFMKF